MSYYLITHIQPFNSTFKNETNYEPALIHTSTTQLTKRQESKFLKVHSAKLKGQIDIMIHSETKMLQRVLEHDSIEKKVEKLENCIFYTKELNTDLKTKIEELKLKNNKMNDIETEKEEWKKKFKAMQIEFLKLKEVAEEFEKEKNLLQLENVEIEDRNQGCIRELIELHQKVIDLEHVNRINGENNRMLFSSQRIEFSRINIGMVVGIGLGYWYS